MAKLYDAPMSTGDNGGSQTEQTRHDSTNRQNLEALAWENSLAEISEYAIFRLDANGIITSWNKGAWKIKGYSRDEIVGRSFVILFNDEDVLKAVPQNELECAASQGSFVGEGWRRKKDGSAFWANVTLTAIHSADGSLIGFIKITRDASKKKQAEEALLAAKSAAESASEAKSRFVSIISHEVRTPLCSIIGFAELLEDPTTPQDLRTEYAAAIRRNSQALRELADQILDLAKVESGKLEINFLSFDPRLLIDELISIFEQMASKRGLKFHFTYPPSLPQAITTDPLRLRQILVNLIGNAIKFTDHGDVSIETNIIPAAENNPGHMAFLIRDTGVGMESHQIDRLFKDFSQIDASAARRRQGSGLGLSLSRKIARALGGDVTLIDTIPGLGSTFQLAIPIHECSMSLSERTEDFHPSTIPILPPPNILKDLTILLAEDAPDNQLLISRILSKHGANVEVAHNGAEAIRRAFSRQYDLILMDLQMPIMDGYEATRHLREQGFRQPIVALTAHAMKSERQRSLEQGFTDYLTKPIEQTTLIYKISNLLHNQPRI
jgi:PAS domain S-box-containing protein